MCFAILSFLHPLFSAAAASCMGLYFARNGRKYLVNYAGDVFLGLVASLVSFWVFWEMGILPKESFLWGLGVLGLFLGTYEVRVWTIEKKGEFVNPFLR